MLVWALVALITSLIIMSHDRHDTYGCGGPEEWTGSDWLWCVAFSIAFPLYYAIQFAMGCEMLCKKINTKAAWKSVHTFLMQPVILKMLEGPSK